MKFPELQTSRLTLVPLTHAHSADMFELWSKPEVCAWVGPVADLDGNPIQLPAQDASDSDKIIRFFEHHQATGGKCRWAVLRADDERFLGIVGFNRFGDACELAYHLNPEFWGNGYMTEAAQAAVRWARTVHSAGAVVAYVEAENHASVALARRLGFSREGEPRDGADRYVLTSDHAPEIRERLAAAGHPVRGEITAFRATGRSRIHVAETDAGKLWIKHAYRLPPGEEVVLEELATRHADRLPRLIATWPGAVAMAQLPGAELDPKGPPADWFTTAEAMGALVAAEREHASAWLERGARDRRPQAFEASVDALLDGELVGRLPGELAARLRLVCVAQVDHFARSFQAPATLLPQDAGCCNIHITDDGPVFYDWADVVVGHPTFCCDRLLDQAPRELWDEIIARFCAAVDLDEAEFRAMRRCNVLHEILRYHDELAHLAPGDGVHDNLVRAIEGQVEVLASIELD